MKGRLPSLTNMFSDGLKLHNFIDQLKMLEYWAVQTLPGWLPGCWKGSIGSIHRDRFLWSLHWVSLGGGFQSLYFRRNLTVAYFFQIGLVQPPTIPIMTAGLSTLVFLWSTKIRWTFWVNWEMRWTNFFSKPHGGPKSRWLFVIRGKASRWDSFFF